MPKIRDFPQVLGLIDGGELVADANQHLTDLMEHLYSMPRGPKDKVKGEITLSLKVQLEGDHVEIAPEIKVKKPIKPRARGFFFALSDGSLSTEHPRQIDMFPRDAEERFSRG